MHVGNRRPVSSTDPGPRGRDVPHGMGDTGRMAALADRPGPPGPVWTAAVVARRLGVAPGTLRSWSQRYGIGPAAHTPGRHRRYTAADIAELEAIRDLVDQGVVLTAAATLVRDQRLAALARGGHGDSDYSTAAAPVAPAAGRGAAAAAPAADTVAELAAAAVRLDSEVAFGIVTTGLAENGVLAAWEQLCRPALDALDTQVAGDRGCIDSQLMLSWVLATCLRWFPSGPSGSGAPDGRPVLLACAPREQHTLGLEALHAALTERRIPARMLGATVPAPALCHATEQLRPGAVVVWAQRATSAARAQLAPLCAHADTVLAAGPGWDPAGLPAAVTPVENLRTALALVAAAARRSPDRGRAGPLSRAAGRAPVPR